MVKKLTEANQCTSRTNIQDRSPFSRLASAQLIGESSESQRRPVDDQSPDWEGEDMRRKQKVANTNFGKILLGLIKDMLKQERTVKLFSEEQLNYLKNKVSKLHRNKRVKHVYIDNFWVPNSPLNEKFRLAFIETIRLSSASFHKKSSKYEQQYIKRLTEEEYRLRSIRR